MPDLFSPYTLKSVTLRNRIVMSPMTMYSSVDGKLDDYHVSYLGARAAGGFALVFGEQMAITPDGRTTTSCAGIWNDDQIEGHARVTAIIERMGAVPAIQLGHTGRKGSLVAPHLRAATQGKQLPPDHPDGWTCVAPSAIPYHGGGLIHPVHQLSVEEIQQLHKAYAAAAVRALDAGYKWLEMHYAHGYLGASFFSPLANQRTDQYGGSVAAGTQFEDAVVAIKMMKEHGLDLADLSLGFNTDEMIDPPMGNVAFMVERAHRVRSEVDIPVATSWNLGVPANADRVIREELIDLVMLGRPALANPHWPVWAARELGHASPFSLVQDDWRWWLDNFRGHPPSIGWPTAAPPLEVGPPD